MKHKMWKRLLATVLAITMIPVGAAVPATEVYADETAHKVTVESDADTITIGNDYISREFSVAGDKLITTKITNKRTDGADTVFVPAAGSEEFKIRTTITLPEAIDRSGWTALADSYHVATPGPGDGPADNVIDGDITTFWHTNYGGGAAGDNAFPHNIVFRLGEETTFECFSYTPRQNHNNGKIADYELWISNSDSSTTLPVDDASWVKVKEGTFTHSGSSAIYVNLDSAATAKQVKFVAKTPVDASHTFATCAEFNLYADKFVTSGADREFGSNAMTLAEAPVVEDTTATINNVEKTGKKITFSFVPYTYNGVEYTIDEVIVMYDGDHFMRKYMEISVPQDKWNDAVIDYIDLESMKVNETDAQWTIPTDAGGIVQMSRFKANLGQPIYIQGMFFGCEFPETDNEIVDGTGYMRYYTGKSFTRFNLDNQLTTDGKYVTWQTVAGAARSLEQDVIQADFFDYINSIATPSDFRIQYNSWFDNMMLISDEMILDSFIEIDRELNKAETRPLDSYVVDDGWVNYNNKSVVDANRAGTTLNQKGFWEFNSKFPLGLTPSSELVEKFGSHFGVWVGPRGGYNFYGSLADIMAEHGTGSKAGGAIDVADREYVKNFTDMAVKWQETYGVNYWKWDGFSDMAQYGHFPAADGVPGYANRHMTGGYEHMYHVTDLWEAWIELFEAVRESEKEDDIYKLWLSLTCYVNPSPWFLQWANSVWIQCTHDQNDAGSSSSKMDRQLTYRDGCYYDFLKNHEFQFPLSNIYNHDPVYGVEGTGMNMNTATDEQFQNYLYMMSTRGSAFWELYYSDSIMTEGKYEVTGEFLAWAEENYHMLRNAKMFGNSPFSGVKLEGPSGGNADAYGFACFDGTDGIISVRNAATAEKTVTMVFDRNIGVPESAGTLQYHIEHSHKLTEGTAQTGEFTYGEEYTFTLQPDEVRIFRVSKDGDTTAPEYTRAYINENNEIIVRFNEKVQNGTFTVNGQKVKAVLSADDITYHITAGSKLTEQLENGMVLTVKAEGLTDLAGNALENTEITTTYYENHIVATTTGKASNVTGIATAEESLQNNDGFSVSAKVYTTATGAIVKQGEEYELGINADGTAYFTLNGTTASYVLPGEDTGIDTEIPGVVAPPEGTEQKVTAIPVNDGQLHSITGVKENNGILKLYVDGELVGSAYSEENRYYEVKPASIEATNVIVANVYDIAYGYNEVADLGSGSTEDSRTPMTITASQLSVVGGTSEGSVEAMLDGNNTTFWTSNKAENGIAAGNPAVVIDLGSNKMIDRVDYTKRFFDSAANIWKCTGNLRGYVVEVSEDGENWTVVSEGNTFDDERYPAALDGGTTKINFTAVKARYVRLSGTASYHHITENVDKFMAVSELKLYEAASSNVALNADVSARWTSNETDAASENPGIRGSVDGRKDNTNAYADFGGNKAESSYLEIDLGEVNLIEKINMYRYWADGRTYKGTVIAVSEKADFSDPIVIYNSDAENKHGFGAGTDTTYAESSTPLTVNVVDRLGDFARAAYIRIYMWGSSANDSNHIVEFEAFGYPTNEVIERIEYSEELPFEFPAEVGTSVTLEMEYLQQNNNTEGDGNWPLQVSKGSWASNGEFLNCLNANDEAVLYYNVENPGTYTAVVTYRSGSEENRLVWAEADGKILEGSVSAGCDDATVTKTATFTFDVLEAGAGVLTFCGGESSAPQLDKIEITATKFGAYEYDVTMLAGENGTITGPDKVARHEDATFTIVPNEGYEVEDVIVNGTSVGAVTTYTVEDVVADITIEATFAEVAEPLPPTQEEQVRSFVERMYTIILGRDADPNGLNDWAAGLMEWRVDGAGIVNGFANSEEFVARNLSDEDFIKTLYLAVLNREADEAGLADWLRAFSLGYTRQQLIDGFVTSAEFIALCDSYGILAEITQRHLVTSFVERMYTVALDREADAAGLEYWVTKLMAGSTDGKTVVNGFVGSPEFEARGLSDEEFIKTLYRTILGREASDADVASWIAAIELGQTRTQIMNGFIESAEFAYLCDGYGISAILTQRDLVTNFVSRMYTVALNREADAAGLNDWVTGLINGVIYGAQVADGFIMSAEFEARGLSDAEYVQTLYMTFFNREASDADVEGWVAAMTVHGQSRRDVMNGFINSAEFEALCNEYGIIRGSL